MTTRVLHFTLPMPPNLTNGRMHWRVLHDTKGEYWETLDKLQSAKKVPPPPRKPWPKATVSATLHLGHAMDDDNAMARTKWILDWLKTRGYIADDTRKNVKWLGFPEQVVKRGAEYRVELVLQEAA